MTFIKTSDGCFVRLDRVREVMPRGKSEVTLSIDGGSERSASMAAWENARWSSEHHVVPAAPGTVVLNVVHGGDRPWVIRQPVLAWGVGPGGFAEAITSTGVGRGEHSCPAFLTPDGCVEDALGFYESYAAWMADVVWQKEHG